MKTAEGSGLCEHSVVNLGAKEGRGHQPTASPEGCSKSAVGTGAQTASGVRAQVQQEASEAETLASRLPQPLLRTWEGLDNFVFIHLISQARCSIFP